MKKGRKSLLFIHFLCLILHQYCCRVIHIFLPLRFTWPRWNAYLLTACNMFLWLNKSTRLHVSLQCIVSRKSDIFICHCYCLHFVHLYQTHTQRKINVAFFIAAKILAGIIWHYAVLRFWARDLLADSLWNCGKRFVIFENVIPLQVLQKCLNSDFSD